MSKRVAIDLLCTCPTVALTQSFIAEDQLLFFLGFLLVILVQGVDNFHGVYCNSLGPQPEIRMPLPGSSIAPGIVFRKQL